MDGETMTGHGTFFIITNAAAYSAFTYQLSFVFFILSTYCWALTLFLATK